MSSAWTVLVLVLHFVASRNSVANGECLLVDGCSCRDQETSELVSLYKLANNQGYPGVQATDGNNVYEYNPCLNLTSFVCKDVAICEHSQNAEPGEYTSLGTQKSVEFLGSPGSSNFQIQLQTSGNQFERKTAYINLFCDRSAVKPVFQYVGQHPSRTYNFNLTSICACPGACNPPPQICTPDPINPCSCHLTDLSGDDELVNIQSLDDPSSPFTTSLQYPSGEKLINATLYFNPCSGMTALPSECKGATACVHTATGYDVVGQPSTGQFLVDPEGNVDITYKSESTTTAETLVHLVCDYTERHLPKITASYSLAFHQVVIEMRSMCACPGACINPPLNCDPLDDCTCRISQGVGTVSLHDLNNPASPLQYHFASPGSGTTFLYNPCGNFSAVGRNHQCINVSGCQFGGEVDPNNPDTVLGFQDTAQFRVSQEGVVTISYTGGYQGRHFSVQLLCNANATSPLLTLIDTNVQNNVHLQLESLHSCPVKTSQR